MPFIVFNLFCTGASTAPFLHIIYLYLLVVLILLALNEATGGFWLFFVTKV